MQRCDACLSFICQSRLEEAWGGGVDLQWGTDLMEEAGCIWQVKTRGDESDARVSRANLSGGGRLKGILT